MMKRIVAIVVLLVLAVAGQVVLSVHRPVKSPAVEEGVFAAFGGLRSVFAEIIWFRADRLQEEGRYVELAQLAHALALAEPHTPLTCIIDTARHTLTTISRYSMTQNYISALH